MLLPDSLKTEIRDYLSELGAEASDVEVEETAAAMLSFALNAGGDTR